MDVFDQSLCRKADFYLNQAEAAVEGEEDAAFTSAENAYTASDRARQYTFSSLIIS
jgi:hypothetical protein